jgi:hypothetical protein
MNSLFDCQDPFRIKSMHLNVFFMCKNSSIGIFNVTEALVKQFVDKYLILIDISKTYKKFFKSFINANKICPIHSLLLL